jgi:hypothetical protein
VVFPLVDGGLYDNDGANGLRGRKVTHAILSGVSPPEDDEGTGFGPGRLLRLITVIHDRLGAATRQHAHEMTHGVSPGDAARDLEGLGDELTALSAAASTPPEIRSRLEEISDRVRQSARVGFPPRGQQYLASAQILLHRSDLARGTFAAPEWGGIEVPIQYRGLVDDLVAELARVRTDFDALEPEIVELLIAQGYYLTDVLLKACMAELLPAPGTGAGWYDGALAPRWPRAETAVRTANASRQDVIVRIKAAQARRIWLGRAPSLEARIWFGALASLTLAGIMALAATTGLGLFFGASRLFELLRR